MNTTENNLNTPNTDQEIYIPLTFLEKHNISPVIFAILSVGILFVLYQGIGGILTLLLVGMKFDESNVNQIRLMTILGQIFLLLIPTLLFSKMVTHKISDYLKFNKAGFLLYIFTIIGIFSLQQILQVYLYLQDMIPVPEGLKQLLKQLKETIESSYNLVAGAKNFGELIYVIIVVAFIPAIVEETVFRGYLQSTLEKSLYPIKSIITGGIIFSLFHLNPINFIPLVIMGIYLGFLYYQSNSLFIPIVAHFFNNLIAVISIYLGHKEETLIGIQEDNISIELLFLNFVFFSIVFLLSVYYFIKASNLKQQN